MLLKTLATSLALPLHFLTGIHALLNAIIFDITAYSEAHCKGDPRTVSAEYTPNGTCYPITYGYLDGAASIGISTTFKTPETAQFLGYSEQPEYEGYSCDPDTLIANATFRANMKHHCIVPRYTDLDVRFYALNRISRG